MVDGRAGAPNDPAASEGTRERARALLAEAGLTKPPRASSPRRLLTVAIAILVVLAAILAGSLLALDRLQRTVTTTTVPPPTIPAPTPSSIPSGSLPAGPPLASYAMASADAAVLQAVGEGGQPLALERTPAPTFLTDPRRDPVVIYWWTGACTPCAAENEVVVSALEALGGTFRGLTTTTEPGEPGQPAPVATIDLRRAAYRGPVVLEAAEVEDARGRPDQPTTGQARLQAAAYDRSPFAPGSGGYAFVDVAGRYVAVGAGFTPALLRGRSVGAVAGQLAVPTSVLARAILGDALQLAAAVCLTLQELGRPRPGVCASPTVSALEAALPVRAPRGAVPAR